MQQRADLPIAMSHRSIPPPPPRRSRHRRRRLVVTSVVSALAVVLALGACGGGDKKSESEGSAAPASSAAPSGGGAVHIVNFEFQPQKLTVKAGTTVMWTNDDSAIHSIKDTSPLATPVSKDLAKGDTFTITYDKPGSYSYICGIHNYMTGSVDVTG